MLPSGTIRYVYDEAGHLLGEYTGLSKTVDLGDTPVALLNAQ
jgi:hypothetical protein